MEMWSSRVASCTYSRCSKEFAEEIDALSEETGMKPWEIVAVMCLMSHMSLCKVPEPDDEIDMEVAEAAFEHDVEAGRWMADRQYRLSLPANHMLHEYRNYEPSIERLCAMINNARDWARFWAVRDPDLERRVWWKAEHDEWEQFIVMLIADYEARRKQRKEQGGPAQCQSETR